MKLEMSWHYLVEVSWKLPSQELQKLAIFANDYDHGVWIHE